MSDERREQRRLAAIVSADVVGYSRLMGHDETGTFAALRAIRRELIDPKIAAHGGRISTRRFAAGSPSPSTVAASSSSGTSRARSASGMGTAAATGRLNRR
jgi:class 3 adenylate cyclase